VLFSFILIPSMKMNGLYLANILNGFVCAGVIAAGAWLVIRRCPRSLEDLMAIPDRIGVAQDSRIDLSVNRMEEVVEISRRVNDFCEQRGVDRRRAFAAGLCMEEMAGNVVSHGFEKDTKKHSVDIRVADKDGVIVMRIRDNCKAFNPSEYALMMEPDGSGKNVGITLAFRFAKETSYQNLLGMNVLTIRI